MVSAYFSSLPHLQQLHGRRGVIQSSVAGIILTLSKAELEKKYSLIFSLFTPLPSAPPPFAQAKAANSVVKGLKLAFA